MYVEVLLGNNTGSDMHKTCLAKSDEDTPIRDLFPISTMERPRQEVVDSSRSCSCVGANAWITAPGAQLPSPKSELLVLFSRCN